MPSITDYFSALINRLRPAQPATSSDERPSPRRRTALPPRFTVDRGLPAEVRDSRAMVAGDTRPKEIISTLARDVVKGGFRVVVSKGTDVKKAQSAADELYQRLRLESRLDDYCRLTFRDGNSFLELSVERSGQIADLTRKPTLLMRRASNHYDRFDDPRRAYWYSEEPWWQPEPPADALWFADWQIIHARWDHDEGARYGTPLFASARKAFRRLDEGEDNIAIRRKTRAGMRYNHKLNTNDPAEVESYLENNKDVLDSPYAPIQDFFGNVEIEAIQGDARLSEIDDVLHHVDTFGVASPVPLELIGYGKALNRDILEQKLEQYERALETVTQWLEDQLVRPLLERQWLLLGIWPGGLEYQIQWASKKTLTPTMLKDIAAAGVQLRGLGWPDEVVIDILAPLIPDFDAGALKQAMAAERASRPDEIGRIAGGAVR